MNRHEFLRRPGSAQFVCRNPNCNGWATTALTERGRLTQRLNHANTRAQHIQTEED